MELSFQIDNNWTPSKIAQKKDIMYNWIINKFNFINGNVGIGTRKPETQPLLELIKILCIIG